jgi:cysteine desulfurase/selenocysteine lyase
MESQHVMEQIIDWRNIRDDFPILRRQVHGKPLTYLD